MEKNEKYDQARARECIVGLERVSHYVTGKQKAHILTAITFLEKTVTVLGILEGKPEALVEAWEEARKSEKAREERGEGAS